ncbi:hypothetical protein Q5752_000262 [Cryptotrichosporon argae]
MDSLPSSSTVPVYLHCGEYDIAQLNRAITAPLPKPEDVPEPSVHLHTLLIQATLTPPPETDVYFDGPRPNPLFAPYVAFLAALRAKTPAYTPIIILPAHAALRMPIEREKLAPYRSADLFFPSSHRLRPALRLPAQFKGQGKVWSPGGTAWDIDNWLHAILALDPALPPTRKTAYRDDKRRFHLRTTVQLSWVPTVEIEDAAFATDEEVEVQVIIDTAIHVDPVELLVPLPGVGADLLGLVLNQLIPSPTNRTFATMSEARAAGLRDFFAALRPAPDLPMSMDARQLQPAGMTCRLLPFQKRTLALLLERERELDAQDGQVKGFWEVGDLGGKKAYMRIAGKVQTVQEDKKGKGKAVDAEAELPSLLDIAGVRGTMLCEEMGLGKTVEAIALIMLHRHPLSVPRSMAAAKPPVAARAPPLPILSLIKGVPGLDDNSIKKWVAKESAGFERTSVWDELSQLSVAQVGATLIVTPPSLLKQWIAEMARHAPKLRVCVYTGWKVLQSEVERSRAAARKRNKAAKDNKEKAVAQAYLERTRNKYAKTGKGTKAAKQETIDESEGEEEAVCGKRRRAPRRKPIKVKEPSEEAAEPTEEAAEDDSLLHLVQSGFVDYVRAHDVVVTTYQTLADDLKVARSVPPRSRRSTADYRINERPRSPLVMVEWWRVIMDEVQLQGDSSSAAEMVSLIPRQCSLAVSGTPARSDIKDLMGSLRFLRVPELPTNSTLWHRLQQPAFRPAFENLFNRLAVRTTKAEVSGEFNLPNQICTHIQVGAFQAGNLGRVERLHLGRELMTMEEALKKMTEEHASDVIVAERSLMKAYIKKGKLLVSDHDDGMRHLNASLAYGNARTAAELQLRALRGQLQSLVGEREGTVVTMDTDEGLEEQNGQEKMISQAEKEKTSAVQYARTAIREVLLILHQSWFFDGDVQHDLKDEEKEVAAYETAEEIRREILSRPLQAANASIGHLDRVLARRPALQTIEELLIERRHRPGGLVTRDPVASIEALWSVMADNATLVHSWRGKIIQLLQTPIEAEAKELPEGQGQDVQDPEAEYYAEALKAQGEKMMLEDRSTLAAHEGKQKKKRTTQRAKDAGDVGHEHVPDDTDALLDELMKEREAFKGGRKAKGCERPLKAYLMDLNAITLGGAREEEVAIAKMMQAEVRAYISRQSVLLEKLNKELDLFRATYNRRIVYFAALQEISDSVAPREFINLADDLSAASQDINSLNTRLATMARKARFLESLAGKDEADIREECSICFGTSDDKAAYMLGCGHSFCVSCFRAFRKTQHIGNKCPSCKVPINEREMTRFALGSASQVKSDAEAATSVTAETGSLEAIQEQERLRRAEDLGRLRVMDDDKRRAVIGVDIMGDFGSKINFLVKHLLHYKVTDPTVVERALHANNIKFVSLSTNGKVADAVEAFHADETISVFLLHAERESSGLTLTSCRVVHLLEPVLQHSFELQGERGLHQLSLTAAIGRVDRLGQKQQTSVFCYATMDTVEARVLSQGVRNGTSIYLKDEEGEASVKAMPNVVSAAQRGGDMSSEGNEHELVKLIM